MSMALSVLGGSNDYSSFLFLSLLRNIWIFTIRVYDMYMDFPLDYRQGHGSKSLRVWIGRGTRDDTRSRRVR